MKLNNACESFPFVVSKTTKLIILGTMPGKISLLHQQYYAHPRNIFWKIIYGAYGLNVEEVYQRRLEFLINKKIGLWDTLQHCERNGSLDVDIKNEQPNNFKLLFEQYPNIKSIAFNGKKAHNYFKKHIGLNPDEYKYFILPSTSPANSTKKYEQKLIEWARVLLNEISYSK
ncbi:MAG: DNA-deoxyinosine glycosylase [Bacteroidia bacterium]